MSKNWSKQFLSDVGQTAIEYLLMLVVIVAVIHAIMLKVKKEFFEDQGNCTKASRSLICQLENAFDHENYRYFYIKK